MSVVGSLIFCTDCGNLLDSLIDKTKDLVCSQCDKSYPSQNFKDLRVITKSSNDAFPSTLKSKRSAVKTVLQRDEAGEGAVKCPQCGHDEMQYHTLQLRSADEGATVFYTCTKCGYRYRTNN